MFVSPIAVVVSLQIELVLLAVLWWLRPIASKWESRAVCWSLIAEAVTVAIV